MARQHAESEAGEHRPSPRDLRRSSRTHWPAWRVLSYVLLELVAAALVILGLVWLLAQS
ncbi:MAG: hypothetical protein IH983_01905 [Planctomycetes bacterium]|nr:hypothetical protein [Planctomycetota bacterium]